MKKPTAKNMKNLLNERSVSYNEMTEYFVAMRPYIPTRRRVALFASSLGFKRVYQMVRGKQFKFYINTRFINDGEV